MVSTSFVHTLPESGIKCTKLWYRAAVRRGGDRPGEHGPGLCDEARAARTANQVRPATVELEPAASQQLRTATSKALYIWPRKPGPYVQQRATDDDRRAPWEGWDDLEPLTQRSHDGSAMRPLSRLLRDHLSPSPPFPADRMSEAIACLRSEDRCNRAAVRRERRLFIDHRRARPHRGMTREPFLGLPRQRSTIKRSCSWSKRAGKGCTSGCTSIGSRRAGGPRTRHETMAPAAGCYRG